VDCIETYFALREAGIYLALSEDRDRLHCEPAAELAPELAEAVADNHDLLLKKELLRELVRFVAGRIAAREGTSTRHLPSIPAAAAVFESMSAERQKISGALEDQTVDDFKRTMRQWSPSTKESASKRTGTGTPNLTPEHSLFTRLRSMGALPLPSRTTANTPASPYSRAF
jgi:hypothetical protein